MSTHQQTPIEHLIYLREHILNRFDKEEVRTLVFDLGINYDDLRSETISVKIQAHLEHLENRSQIPVLLVTLKRHRPNADWDSYLLTKPEALSPYKGLQYFTQDDASLFFGRKQLTAELVNHLRQHRFLVIVGASGSGKSSVVRAGVIPAVRRGDIVEDDNSSANCPFTLLPLAINPSKPWLQV